MWPLAVVMGDPALTVFFIRKCMAVLPDRKRVAVITRCPYYRGGQLIRQIRVDGRSEAYMSHILCCAILQRFVSCFFRTQLDTGAPVRPLTRLRRCICRLKLTSMIVSGAHAPHITEREIFNF